MTLCYILHQTHWEFWQIQQPVFRYMPAYSIIFIVNEAHSSMLRHYLGIFRLIQAHPAPCVTLAYWYPCHFLSPIIFRTGDLRKTLWNVEQVYLEPCIFRMPRALFSHVQAYSEPYATLTYEETWHTRNPGIFRTLP